MALFCYCSRAQIFQKKYRKSPSPLCALSKLADIVVDPSKKQLLDEEENANFNKGAAQEPKQPAPG